MFVKCFFILFILMTSAQGELKKIVEKKITDITINVKSQNNQLIFDWPTEKQCALFKSGECWWLVFNSSAQEFNLPKDRDLPTGIVDLNPYFEIHASGDVTVFQIKVYDGFDISLKKEKNTWILSVDNVAIENDIIENEGHIRPLISVNKFGLIHHLKAEIKKWPNCCISNILNFKEILIENTRNYKRYTVILTGGDDHGLDSVIETPYYQLLLSKQGAVFLHFSDRIVSTHGQNEVNITALDAPEEIPLSKAFDLNKKTHSFQASIFQKISTDDLKKQMEDLIDRMNQQTTIDPFLSLEKAWVTLLLANPLESLSLINLVESYYPALSHHPFVRSLKACAFMFQNAYKRARDELLFLPNTLEVQILKGVVFSNLGLPIAEIGHLKKVVFFLQNYNQDLVDQFLSEVFLVCINAANYETILRIFDSVEMPKNSYFKPHYEYAKLISRRFVEKDTLNSNDMLKLFNTYSKTTFPTQLKAYVLYSIATLGYAEKKITADDYVKKLIDLQLLWRGDYLEFKLLKKIADVYVANHQYLNAITYFEKLKNIFKENFKALHLDKKIENAFNQFFKEKLYKKTSPLKVIRVFEKYKDYTPETDDGKEIINTISMTLVNLDLLDQAAELLNKQAMVEKDDQTRAKLYMQIAQIHLANKNGEAALSTLEKFPASEYSKFASQIVDIKTKAFVILNKLDNALQVLADDNSLESIKKSSDFLMTQKQWYKARLRYLDLLMRLETEKNDALKMDVLVKLALLNILLEEPFENEALRISYESFISGQPKERQDEFNYYVDDIDKEKVNRNNIDEQLKNVDKILKTKKIMTN
ncbi:MAG: hypothetical protein HEEMFOPI_01349 [Holosporales bacterium]